VIVDLELRRNVVLEQPELDRRLGLFDNAQHHNPHESFIQVA